MAAKAAFVTVKICYTVYLFLFPEQWFWIDYIITKARGLMTTHSDT